MPECSGTGSASMSPHMATVFDDSHHARISYAVVFNPELFKTRQDIPFLGSIICFATQIVTTFCSTKHDDVTQFRNIFVSLKFVRFPLVFWQHPPTVFFQRTLNREQPIP